MVKVKSKEFAIERLTKKQSTHSKMENLVYKELKMQRYMLNDELNPNQKKILFKFRTRMAEFGENYRGGRAQVICPLCNVHLDNQEMSYQCPQIKSEVQIEGKIEDIYKEEINVKTVKTIAKITEVRKSRQEEQ